MIGQDLRAFVCEESMAAISSNLIRRRKGEKGQADYRMRRGDGSKFWATVSANPLFTDGVFEGTVYALNDITERKEAEMALQESEERFRCLTEGSPHAIAMVSGSKLTYVNPKWVRMFGSVGAEELLYRPVLESFAPRCRPKVEDLFRVCADQGAGSELETIVVRQDGSELPATMSATRMRIGESPAIVAVLTDVSERKRAEEALREGQHFVNHVLSTDPTGIMVYDLPSRRIAYINDRVTKVTGRTLEQLQGTDEVLRSMVHPDDLPALVDTTTKVVMGTDDEVHETEVRIRDLDGGWRWVHFYGTPFLREGSGRVVQTISGIWDISDRKRAEMEVQKVRHKLELLSDITRHDIRNQIMMIMGNVELCRLPTSDHADRLERIERAATIINSHIEFAKDYQELGTTEPVWQGVARTVEGLDIGRGVNGLEISDPARRLEICADPMLKKVFHNLLEDSIKYAGPQTLVRIDCDINEGNLKISYQDDGPGVPSEEKELIFAKGHGRGTGLGLFLSREILGITGIMIAETGQPGEGVRFEMDIPPGQFRFR
jgi:PAS domain S-box-containing protein